VKSEPRDRRRSDPLLRRRSDSPAYTAAPTPPLVTAGKDPDAGGRQQLALEDGLARCSLSLSLSLSRRAAALPAFKSHRPAHRRILPEPPPPPPPPLISLSQIRLHRRTAPSRASLQKYLLSAARSLSPNSPIRRRATYNSRARRRSPLPQLAVGIASGRNC